jgi:hypothetical protein
LINAVTLSPANAEFEPIELTCEDEGEVRVVAEMVEVLGTEVSAEGV